MSLQEKEYEEFNYQTHTAAHNTLSSTNWYHWDNGSFTTAEASWLFTIFDEVTGRKREEIKPLTLYAEFHSVFLTGQRK
jgi:hypothetical protein